MDRHPHFGLLLSVYTLGVSLAYAALTLTNEQIGTASIVAFVALLVVPHCIWGRPRR